MTFPIIGRNAPITAYFNQGFIEECWLWKGYVGKDGYGRFGKSEKAHRAVYKYFKGPIPEGMHLDHVKEKCSNRACVNPNHLEVVTQKENNRRGKKTKLTLEQVVKIKERLRNGEHHFAIASHFSVTPENILAIKFGKTWN